MVNRTVLLRVQVEIEEEEVNVRKGSPLAEILGAAYEMKPLEESTRKRPMDVPEKLSESTIIKFTQRTPPAQGDVKIHYGTCD
jgi:hypothetical protein